MDSFRSKTKKVVIAGVIILVIAILLILASTTSSPSSKRILNPPGSNASEEEETRYYDLVAETAETAATLDLSGCRPKPTAMEVTWNQTFKVRNQDALPHILVINADYEYLIPARSQKEIVADFGKGPGVYGFGCDESEEAVGVILLTE